MSVSDLTGLPHAEICSSSLAGDAPKPPGCQHGRDLVPCAPGDGPAGAWDVTPSRGQAPQTSGHKGLSSRLSSRKSRMSLSQVFGVGISWGFVRGTCTSGTCPGRRTPTFWLRGFLRDTYRRYMSLCFPNSGAPDGLSADEETQLGYFTETGFPMGADAWLAGLETKSGRRLRPRPSGRPRSGTG